MASESGWAFPGKLQPKPDKWPFDLGAALDAVVELRAEVPEDAFTAQILGTERAGNGIVIRDDGLVLTIGYLVTEASTIWLTTNRGAVVSGTVLAYDQPTGFGLVQALGKLGVPALARGSAATCKVGDRMMLAGHGGRSHTLEAKIFAKREFAGYWEYVLDEAIYTWPAHPQWGGAALIGADGKLAGVGSLLVQEKEGERTLQGNMIVPIDLLEPILNDLLTMGRANRPPRPWLGLYATEIGEHLVVAGLAEGSPAEKAELEVGDVLLEVAGERIAGLADLFRRIWRLGAAGVEVPLTYAREGNVARAHLKSADRSDFLKKPHLH
jgi:S1-C subfamily serine protease